LAGGVCVLSVVGPRGGRGAPQIPLWSGRLSRLSPRKLRMVRGFRVVVVMPAYDAERTLRKCYESLPHDIVDEVVLVDDASADRTAEVALDLGVQTVIKHDRNRGYGGNQKTCYTVALDHGADIVVMIHPDYQYAPTLCGAMAWMVASGEYDVVLGSRILGNSALRNGMPVWKYVANRALTALE